MMSFIWVSDPTWKSHMEEPLESTNGESPDKKSRRGRDAKRVVRDARGNLGLGIRGRMPPRLVTLLVEEIHKGALGAVSLEEFGMETMWQ